MFAVQSSIFRHRSSCFPSTISYQLSTALESRPSTGWQGTAIKQNMKTAYELAMERLDKTAPAVKLTAAQKKALAELDTKYAATIAGREIALKDEMAKVSAAGDFEKVGALREQLANERKKLQAELEEKKDAVRHAAGGRK
jgi:hypothetical protein